MADGFTTGTTPGTGLGSVRRQSNEFDIFSRVDDGTLIVSQVMNEHYQKNQKYTVSAICTPIHGEEVCGDAWCVSQHDENLSIIVVDGLGHGVFANKAATEAIDVFRSRKKENLEQLLQLIHGRLKSTRGGAVFMIDKFDTDKIQYLGIGNIRAILSTPAKIRTLISQNGTAGLQMRTTKTLSQDWAGDGFMILHSDGISSRWDLSAYPSLQFKHPALTAALIYRNFSRGTDDTTVLVIGRNK